MLQPEDIKYIPNNGTKRGIFQMVCANQGMALADFLGMEFIEHRHGPIMGYDGTKDPVEITEEENMEYVIFNAIVNTLDGPKEFHFGSYAAERGAPSRAPQEIAEIAFAQYVRYVNYVEYWISTAREKEHAA